MNTVELFCGKKSFSTIAALRGYSTFTVDVNKRFKPDLLKNIHNLVPGDLPDHIDVLWLSPPCDHFSRQSMHKHWKKNTPLTIFAQQALVLVDRLQWLIGSLQQKNPSLIFYLENPMGKLRDFLPYTRHTVTYCCYGDTKQKPTDLFTNDQNWIPKPPCYSFRNDICITSTTVNEINSRILRAAVPPLLINSLLDSAEQYL